ncbi:hemolysin III family protein [Pseudoruegeria sp. SK021]|uniref:PAQR family membrane homeostasis protein TrhA n=1 Tax=Pseudoruegeria sp. SK021 TaxID=1933035 RepID=UPI000A243443|nr:hemolysin III family protein [Pseudoruegeria sp. SK021]OSP56010.1 Hly-III family protein [Pseudoruegeria sp. SK021]
MTSSRSDLSQYSRAELRSDAVVHIVGLVAALISAPVLIALSAVWRGDTPAILGVTIYGLTLVAMILCSALYNMVHRQSWQKWLRRLDHSAIYLKIAGTFTPLALLSGAPVALLLSSLWASAFAGCGLRIFAPNRFRWLALTLYLAMGWAGVFGGWGLISQFSGPVKALILTGGGLYTVGMGFYLWERLPFHNTIWHVFVLVATVTFYAAITIHLADTAQILT